MKIVDLQEYRAKREIALLEKKVGNLVLLSPTGCASAIKICFKEWLYRVNG